MLLLVIVALCVDCTLECMRSGKLDKDCVGDLESIPVELNRDGNWVDVGSTSGLLANGCSLESDCSLDSGADDICLTDEPFLMSTVGAGNNCVIRRDTVIMYEM